MKIRVGYIFVAMIAFSAFLNFSANDYKTNWVISPLATISVALQNYENFSGEDDYKDPYLPLGIDLEMLSYLAIYFEVIVMTISSLFLIRLNLVLLGVMFLIFMCSGFVLCNTRWSFLQIGTWGFMVSMTGLFVCNYIRQRSAGSVIKNRKLKTP